MRSDSGPLRGPAEASADIQQAYEEIGHTIGWRFLQGCRTFSIRDYWSCILRKRGQRNGTYYG
jgi:hypothetical protein